MGWFINILTLILVMFTAYCAGHDDRYGMVFFGLMSLWCMLVSHAYIIEQNMKNFRK